MTDINYCGSKEQRRALETKLVTPEQALQFTNMCQVDVLKTGVDPKDALLFTHWCQV